MVRAANNANWETVLLAKREGSVPACERLVVGLLTSALISSPVTGVDNHVPVVSVVLVSARENNRFRALRLASGDAGLDRHVHPALVEFSAILEKASLKISGYVSENSFRHAETYRIIRFVRFWHLASPQ